MLVSRKVLRTYYMGKHDELVTNTHTSEGNTLL